VTISHMSSHLCGCPQASTASIPSALLRPSGPGYAVAPMFGVRIAGAPVEDLQRLEFRTTWDVVDKHVELIAWLRTEGEAISDLLHSFIGTCGDGGIKPMLVALRRAVFQTKGPGDRVWSEGVRRVLPTDLTARIAVWLSALERARALEVRLSGVLAAEKSARTDALREVAAKNAFRFGLLLGSPTLADVLGAWIDGPSAGCPRGPVLLRLTKYLSRVVAKTSPYASFTFSGLGVWAQSGSASCPTGELTWRSVAELDRRVVLWIWSGLACHPEFREHIRLRLNPSVIEVDGQLRFLGAAMGEPVVSVAITDTLRYVLHFVRTMPQPTLGGLRRNLQGAGTLANPGSCLSYVDTLIDLGLLELRPPFLDQGADPLGDLADWVATAADASIDGANGWYQALCTLRAAVRGYAELPDARARIEQLRHIRSMLTELLAELAHPAVPELPAKDVVRENAVITHQAARCSWKHWQPVFDDLDALRGFLGIFNPYLALTTRATAFFLDRFGPFTTVPFLEFYRELHACSSTGSYQAEGAGLVVSGPPGVQELAERRRAAVETLYSVGQDASGIVRVHPRTLARIAASWPPDIRTPGSICCYAQEIPSQDGPRLVLNVVRTGYGWGISRIQHLIDQTGDPTLVPQQRWPRTDDTRVLLAECRAAFATNMNLRLAAVPYAIDYPRAESDTDAAAQVSIAELQVSYDQVPGRLALRERHGAEVRPLSLGMLVEHALPPALRFLIRVFGEPQTLLVPDRQLSDVGWRSGIDGVRSRPRLEVGRIVLARAAWSLPAHQFPLRKKGESDAVHLLRLARWRDEHGIPRQCFVRLTATASGAGQDWSLSKARKPLYLDFANWFLLTAFDRALVHLRHPDAVVVFEEALPDLADAPHYGQHGQRVTEYIFELSSGTADG
jgi:hypothetical protein